MASSLELAIKAISNPDALSVAPQRVIEEDGLRRQFGDNAGHCTRGKSDQRAVARVSLRTYAAVAARRGLSWPAGLTGEARALAP